MQKPRGEPQADSSDYGVVPGIKKACGNNVEDPEQHLGVQSRVLPHQAPTAPLFPQHSVLAISDTAAL